MPSLILGDLFERAILWEKSARDLYLRIAALASRPEIAEQWRGSVRMSYAYSMSTNELWECAASTEVLTLDEAYELAHELESSRINTVFGILVTPIDDSSSSAPLSAQFDEHLEVLRRLGERYDYALRARIAIDVPVDSPPATE